MHAFTGVACRFDHSNQNLMVSKSNLARDLPDVYALALFGIVHIYQANPSLLYYT